MRVQRRSAPPLDLATVVKASQAISGEIELAKLVRTLMTIAVQIGGADRGLLIISRDRADRIEAEARAIGGEVAVVADGAPVTEHRLALSIVRRVIESGEHCLWADASRPQHDCGDPYLRGATTGSILCLPLLKQTKVLGALYLEAASDACPFTAERIDVLKMLAAQSVISLDNARLYRDRKKLGAQVWRLFESNVIGFYIFDWGSDTRISAANDMVLNLLGYSREELQSGKIAWSDLTPPEGGVHDAEAAASLQETGRCEPKERELVRKDGSRVPVLVGGAMFEGSTHEGIGFLLDLTERKQAELRQKILVDELNHRVKNTLATVQSVCAQTLRTAASPEAFKDEFNNRIVALSQTHNVLNKSGWHDASLREVLETILAPHGAGPNLRFEVCGEDVRLGPTSAVALGMAFHELATNAVKYGALSIPSGRVGIRFQKEASGRLEIVWEELGGPAVEAPSRRGFGSRLIERSLPAQLHGQVELKFLPQGVRCEMRAELAEICRT